MRAGTDPLGRPLPERIEGERILLRSLADDDALEFAELVARNIEHLAHMPWAEHEPLSIDARRALIASFIEERERSLGGAYGIEVAGRLVGMAGAIARRPERASLEIGYWIGAEAEGRGLVSEAVGLLVEEAASHDDVELLVICVAEGNERSMAVARRCGFTEVAAERWAPAGPGPATVVFHRVR